MKSPLASIAILLALFSASCRKTPVIGTGEFSTGSPVTVSARTDKAVIHANEVFRLLVEVQIAPGWHIYAMDRSAGVAAPTKIKIELPREMELIGSWETLSPMVNALMPSGPVATYSDTASFQQALRISTNAPPKAETICGTLSYQACDRFSCRAPEELPFEIEVLITR